MSGITITKELNEVFGNCIKITNDLIELAVTVDIGPRIINFSRVGMENIFYQDIKKNSLGEKLEAYDDIIRLYGGHRLWVSPEVMPRCYYPDSVPVKFEETESGIRFTAPIEKINNIQKSISVIMDESSPFVRLEHTITNCGHFEIELAPWAITMLDMGAVEVVPMPKTKTGFLPNRNLILWDYTDLSDERVKFLKDYIILSSNSKAKSAFKIGLNNEDGWIAVFSKGQLFLKFFEPSADGFYPDGGCTYETYTNNVMLESETLGELTILQPGDSVSHIEEWELYEEGGLKSLDDDTITKLISNYIKI